MRDAKQELRQTPVVLDRPADDPPRDHERGRVDLADDPRQLGGRQGRPNVLHHLSPTPMTFDG